MYLVANLFFFLGLCKQTLPSHCWFFLQKIMTFIFFLFIYMFLYYLRCNCVVHYFKLSFAKKFMSLKIIFLFKKYI
jgi:hypothetical protein